MSENEIKGEQAEEKKNRISILKRLKEDIGLKFCLAIAGFFIVSTIVFIYGGKAGNLTLNLTCRILAIIGSFFCLVAYFLASMAKDNSLTDEPMDMETLANDETASRKIRILSKCAVVCCKIILFSIASVTGILTSYMLLYKTVGVVFVIISGSILYPFIRYLSKKVERNEIKPITLLVLITITIVLLVVCFAMAEEYIRSLEWF